MHILIFKMVLLQGSQKHTILLFHCIEFPIRYAQEKYCYIQITPELSYWLSTGEIWMSMYLVYSEPIRICYEFMDIEKQMMHTTSRLLLVMPLLEANAELLCIGRQRTYPWRIKLHLLNDEQFIRASMYRWPCVYMWVCMLFEYNISSYLDMWWWSWFDIWDTMYTKLSHEVLTINLNNIIKGFCSFCGHIRIRFKTLFNEFIIVWI